MHALAQSAPSDLAALCGALGIAEIASRAAPERVLERLLDLPRSVELGAVLDLRERSGKLVPDRNACEAERARLGLFEERLVRRLGELRGELDRSWTATGRAGRGRPDATELQALIEEHLAGEARSKAPAFAARLAQRCTARPSAALATTLKELAWLRQDLRATLRQGCAHSQSLSALDATLDGALRAELERCHTRLEQELARTVENGIGRALDQAEVDARAAAASWLGRDGCIGRVAVQGRRLSNALLDVEWAALMGLLQAALEPLRALSRSLPPPLPPEDMQR